MFWSKNFEFYPTDDDIGVGNEVVPSFVSG